MNLLCGMFGKSRKAQLFTIVAIALLLLSFITYEIYSALQNREAVEMRIKSMNEFVRLSKQDMEKQLYVFGFRMLFLLEDNISKTGHYVSNVSTLIEETFFARTEMSNHELIRDVTLDSIVSNVQQQAEKIGLSFNFTNPELDVLHYSPWYVSFVLRGELNVTDKAGLAYWLNNETIIANVSILGFVDPLFLVETGGKIVHVINATPYEGNYAHDSDVSNLLEHLENDYYAWHDDAPSFLMRLEGNLSASEYGIESFVDLAELSQQGISVQEGKSCVDHVYFSSTNPISYQIIGMPSWFWLDNETGHLMKYNVSELTA